MRLIQKKTGKRYSAQRIADELNRLGYSLEEENLYLFDYRSEAADELSEAFGTDFTRKRCTLESIKKVSAAAKTRSLC
ncbi:MAG: winged helix-turn-helix domain-containing protein [Oscillospiraceae bacterium]|jgi:hypothetical protein|nr:winged helix-turn-helix domain-containing protein [Oscillospiraceae bacterium]